MGAVRDFPPRPIESKAVHAEINIIVRNSIFRRAAACVGGRVGSSVFDRVAVSDSICQWGAIVGEFDLANKRCGVV